MTPLKTDYNEYLTLYTMINKMQTHSLVSICFFRIFQNLFLILFLSFLAISQKSLNYPVLYYSINIMNAEMVKVLKKNDFCIIFSLNISFEGIKELIINFLNYVNTGYNQDLLSMFDRMKFEYANAIRTCLQI